MVGNQLFGALPPPIELEYGAVHTKLKYINKTMVVRGSETLFVDFFIVLFCESLLPMFCALI